MFIGPNKIVVDDIPNVFCENELIFGDESPHAQSNVGLKFLFSNFWIRLVARTLKPTNVFSGKNSVLIKVQK